MDFAIDTALNELRWLYPPSHFNFWVIIERICINALNSQKGMCFWSLFCQFRVFVSEMSSDQVNKTMTLVHARKPKDKMRCRGCNQFKKPKQATEYYRRNSRNAIFRNCQRRVPQNTYKTRNGNRTIMQMVGRHPFHLHFFQNFVVGRSTGFIYRRFGCHYINIRGKFYFKSSRSEMTCKIPSRIPVFPY